MQAVISREKDPSAPGVVTVGSFNAGTTANIIPDTANLKMTLRSFRPEVRLALRAAVERVARASAEMAGAPPPRIISLFGIGSVVNDAVLTGRMRGIVEQAFGHRAIFAPALAPAVMASEDFSVFGDAGILILFYQIGGTAPETFAGRQTSDHAYHFVYCMIPIFVKCALVSVHP